MIDTNNDRPIGSNPIADAAAATAPSTSATDTTYPADAPKVSSNADLRVKDEDDDLDGAAMSPTGLDIANDHADESPVDRSQDSSQSYANNEDDDAGHDELDDEDDDDEQFMPTE